MLKLRIPRLPQAVLLRRAALAYLIVWVLSPPLAYGTTWRVLAVLVQAGDAVTKGQRLAVLEAMKMEHQLVARRDGVVERVAVRAGDQVATRAVIATLVEAAATS